MRTKQFAVDALSLTVPTSGWQIPGTVSSVHPPRFTYSSSAGQDKTARVAQWNNT